MKNFFIEINAATHCMRKIRRNFWKALIEVLQLKLKDSETALKQAKRLLASVWYGAKANNKL